MVLKYKLNNNIINIDSSNSELKNVDVTTAIYPGFPTDMQAQWTAYMSIVPGSSKVTDTIYIDRFKHIPELNQIRCKY